MAVLIYFFTAILGIAAFADATDFCHMKTCTGPHTMCQFKSAKPSSKCGAVKAASLTLGEQQEILKAHNTLRTRIARGQETRGAPGKQPAGKIPPLKWDKELEQVAQRWANQCDPTRHDSCRDVDRYHVGQNIGIEWRSNGYYTKLSDIVQKWYDEVNMFDSRRAAHYQHNDSTGHYTQLVWGNTTMIGCGVVRYKQMKDRYSTYLVCNYGPRGNHLAPWSKSVYKTF